MKEPQINISQPLLERYLLNEVRPEEKKQVEAALKQDKQLQQKLKELKETNVDFYKDYPVEREINIIEQKYKWSKKTKTAKAPSVRGKLFYKPAYQISFALSFMLVAALSGIWLRQNPSQPDTILKGLSPKLEVYLKTASGPRRLKNQDRLSAGQTIQLQYQAAGQKYGVIFSVDGRQNLTLHFPERNFSDTELSPQGKVSLDYSYQLDDAPQYEKFFFITSTQPLDPEDILDIYKEKWSKHPDFEKNAKIDSEKKMYSITLLKNEL